MIRSYFDLSRDYKSKYGEKTIVFMQCGGFYEIYGLRNEHGQIKTHLTPIEDFSKTVEYAIVDKKVCVNQQRVVMAGFKTYFIEKMVKKMQQAGFTVVVYTQKEQKEKDFDGFSINSDLVKKADEDAIILHCLPAYRSKEITDEMFESSMSRIFEQAENRMHVQQALLACLLS